MTRHSCPSYHSLGQNLVGFVFDWRRTGLVDEWELDFCWGVASQVLNLWFIICEAHLSYYSTIASDSERNVSS